MEVIVARAYGFCFGVRDAIADTESVADPANATIYGEIVHNERVRARIAERGFRVMDETDRAVPDTPVVLVTPHGIGDSDRKRLEAAGRTLVDTTCPLVKVAHDAARELAAEGRFVVVVGRRDHVEVKGLVQDLERFAVVADASEVGAIDADRIGVLSQTTTAEPVFDAAVRAVCDRNPGRDVRAIDTICKPTKDRQSAMADLLPRVEAVVVVGGKGSRNSRELVRAAEEKGIRATLVQGAADLDPSFFRGISRVGLTAGTSTPKEALDEVHRALLAL